MIVNHAKALGIGAAVLLWAASAPAPAQTIPQRVAQPLRAAGNILTGGQYGTQGYSAYGYTTGSPYQYAAPTAPTYTYTPGYGWTSPQPTYQAYAPAQPGYPTTYYNSGYQGYARPGKAKQGLKRMNPVNRARSFVQPRVYTQPAYPTYPTYTTPGYAPTYGYTVPR
jgi:hypothetical protein